MKKYLTIFILLFQSIVIGQCDNKVSTNPYEPFNLALPDDPNSGIPYAFDQLYLNGLNWWEPDQYQLTDMEFNIGQPYGPMSNIQAPSSLPHYDYLNKFNGDIEELNPNNGWELLLVNLGRFPDNVTPHGSLDLTSAPYIVLYNKYKGIARVFVKYGYNTFPDNAINGVKIYLKYSVGASASGILRLGEGYDKALDQVTTMTELVALAPTAGTTNFWMSADFQLTYDPCVCFFPSKLHLVFEYFSTTDFKLAGRGVEITEPLTSGIHLLDNGFLSNIDYTSGNATNGSIIYKELEKMLIDYKNKLEKYKDDLDLAQQHNAEVNQNLAVIKAIILIKDIGFAAAVGSPPVLALANLASEFFFDDTSEGSKKKVDKLFKKAEEIISKEFKLYINENFKKENTPAKPTMPTAAFSEMSFSGQLTNVQLINGPLFYTPGSFVNQVDQTTFENNILDQVSQNGIYAHEYPVYNQPVGVFALLKSPKLKISRLNEISYQNHIDGLYTNQGNLYRFFTNEKFKYQIQLKEPLVYTFNNGLDIIDSKIEASYLFELKKPETLSDALFNVPSSYFQNTFVHNISIVADNENSVNVTSMNVDNDSCNYNNYVNNPTILYGGQNTPYSLDATLHNNFFYGQEKPWQPVSGDIVKYSSLSVPIDALNQLVCQIEWNGQMGITTNTSNMAYCYDYKKYFKMPSDYNVYLKLAIEVTYSGSHDDGREHSYNYIYTYKINPDDIDELSTDINPNIVGSNSDYTQYMNDLTFDGEVFDGSLVENCKLNGNNYTCKSYKNIYITDNITTLNGYSVDFIAGNEIIVTPNSVLNGEIVLQINPLEYDLSSPTFEAENQVVKEFCGTPNSPSNYIANSLGKSLNIVDSITTTINDQLLDELTDRRFIIYPNPAKNILYTRLDREYAKVIISIYDSYGREVFSESKDNVELIESNISGLSNGVYFVKIIANNEVQTKKLIIK